MHKSFSYSVLLVLLFNFSLFAQLDDTQVLDREKIPVSNVQLKKFVSCDSMDSVLSEYFRKQLFSQISGYGDGGIYPGLERMNDGLIAPTNSDVSSPAMAEMSKSSVSGGGEVFMSQTNVQIEGIDESEVVKTDGKYIYYVSNTPDQDGFQYVYIASAVPSSELSLVKRIKLPSTYSNLSLYLSDGKLTILANKWNNNYRPPVSLISRGNSSETIVVVYDVTVPSKPVLDQYYSVSGNLSQSRRNGDFLYVLSQDFITLNTWGYRGVFDKASIQKYIDTEFRYDTLLPQVVEVKRNTNGTSNLPWKGKNLPYSFQKSSIPCEEIEYLLPEKPDNLSFLTLSIIPLSWKWKIQKKVIYGDASQFFMSLDSLYIVSNYWQQGGDFACPMNARCMMPFFRSEQNSLIHKFRMNKDKVDYVYTVLTPGTPLSQYAMNERDGVLYTAHQRDMMTNGVDLFAIDANGKLLSKIENIGPNERFQSSRYIGNRLYLVTFEQVDPLFVIDTTDPKKMKVLGELVMPGYSTYLHPYDANHLIGIGYDTKTNTWGGTSNAGIKIDLYDVTDVSVPKQKFSKVFGGIGSHSDALSNPRALVWDATNKNLLLPVQLLDQNITTYENLTAWQWLMVVGIDKNAGIAEKARISHIDMTGIAEKRKKACAAYGSVSHEKKCFTHVTTGEKTCLDPSEVSGQKIPLYCFSEYDDTSFIATNFWEYSNSFIQRGVYINKSLYTVSPSFIQANTYGGNYALEKKVGLGK
jgi:inhibitor of cysteine peptidase